MIQQYVLCYAHPLPHMWWPEVLLIEKKKPVWQSNRYNLPGGKIEDGETPHDAAERELFEETGIQCKETKLLGQLEGPDFVVYVMYCAFNSLCGLNRSETKTDEWVFWFPLEDALRSKKLIDNLRIIIPLCRSGVTGWTIREASGDLLVAVSA